MDYSGYLRNEMYFRPRVNCHIIWPDAIRKIESAYYITTDYDKYSLYVVNIFTPDQLPIYFRSDGNYRTIKFWYYKSFQVRQFIHDLFENIQRSTKYAHPSIDDKMKSFSDIYFNNTDENEEDDDMDMKEIKTNTDYDYILSKCPRWDAKLPSFDDWWPMQSSSESLTASQVYMTDEPYEHRFTHFNLYMIRMKSTSELTSNLNVIICQGNMLDHLFMFGLMNLIHCNL